MSTLNRVNWAELEDRMRARMKTTPHGAKGELAAVLDITPTHLSQIMSRKRHIPRDLAERIMAHYGLGIDYGVTGGEL